MKFSRRKVALKSSNDQKNNVIDSWLEKYGDPKIDRLVSKNLAIAQKIKEILDSKNMRASNLAELMGKQKSEVSKWLSGQHTFSMRTITAIETALNSEIVHVVPKIKNVYFTTYVCYGAKVKEKEEAQFIDSDYIGEYSA